MKKQTDKYTRKLQLDYKMYIINKNHISPNVY